MTIRKTNKDNIEKLTPHVVSLVATKDYQNNGNPLQFWTKHDTKPCHVDLTDLAFGQALPKKAGLQARWLGGYAGRPQLIDELLPAIKEKLTWAAEKTCEGLVANLKSWWRLFDEIERKDSKTDLQIHKVSSVKDLTHLHQQLAVQRFSPTTFSAFRSIADATRRALGQSPLEWIGPGERQTTRKLPTPEQSRKLFLGIKRGWLDALDRWTLVEQMLSGSRAPETERERSLLRNASYLVETLDLQASKGNAFFKVESAILRWTEENGTSRAAMAREGLSTQVMQEALYPTSTDIRMAFHLALIGGGWNVQTLLDLKVKTDALGDARTPFLKNHPQDPSRYILVGFKARGYSNHVLHGDWKTDRSPGKIIKTLVEKTWPVRMGIVDELKRAEAQLQIAIANDANHDEITAQKKAIVELRRKSTSVWLSVSKGSVEALSSTTYDKNSRTVQFLHQLIGEMNVRVKNENVLDKVPIITASDFRDIFAEYIYRTSGGSVLAVKRLLGHRSLESTTRYLNNTVISQESNRVFKLYTDAMWKMVSERGHVDHTELKQIVEKGEITEEMKSRLEEYRHLKKSRLKMACKDPKNPPEQLSPFFNADGSQMCPTQRCTLCEHAILTPESIEGLAMRLSELKYLKLHIPIENFQRGADTSFQAEMESTQYALERFEPESVDHFVELWEARLSRGEHRVPEFSGNPRIAQKS